MSTQTAQQMQAETIARLPMFTADQIERRWRFWPGTPAQAEELAQKWRTLWAQSGRTAPHLSLPC